MTLLTGESSAPPPTEPNDLRSSLLTHYDGVRRLTEELAAPLSAEDQTVQSMPDVSPTKWHRAHVTWFFETFVLSRRPEHRPFDPAFGYLFNSYYEQVGDRYPRPERGFVTRPGIAEIADYRRHVDAAVAEQIESAPEGELRALAALIELGLHHEQQHQELLLMDIKHVLSRTPFRPAYREQDHGPVTDPGPAGWVDFEGGLVEIGTDGDHFHFDNEGPRHRVFLEPYRLADRLVTAGEWLEFMADGGYRQAPLWLSEGWYTVQREGWEAPLYWFREGQDWLVHTLAGPRPVDPHEPVCHVSSFEAHAYAEWVGHRLPTEAEWEHAAADQPIEGAFLEPDVLHPTRASGSGLRQLFGDVWEQTSSAYLPYPGFQAPEGAIGEYNGKFMSNQMVLRGGCAFTPRGHTRSTYRNFFPSHSRWMLSGVRLAGGSQ